MRIALLGGTFNPLHIGHCMLADSVLCDLPYDKVLFVPTNIPPHKKMNEAVSAEDRFLMVDSFCKSAAIGGTERFFAEDCEIKRGGVSYACDTLRHIIEKYGDKIDGRPALIMGQDTAAEFYKWKNADYIAQTADLIIARRNAGFNGVDARGFANAPENGYGSGADFQAAASLHAFEAEFHSRIACRYALLENPLLPVSSTEIRARIAQGKSWRYLVPDAAYRYIAEKGLYGAAVIN